MTDKPTALTAEQIEHWRRVCLSHWATDVTKPIDSNGCRPWLEHAASIGQAHALCDMALASLSPSVAEGDELAVRSPKDRRIGQSHTQKILYLKSNKERRTGPRNRRSWMHTDTRCNKAATRIASLESQNKEAKERIAELGDAHDKLMLRSVGAMAIAEGNEGHQNISRDCPMLVAVSALRDAYDAAEAALAEAKRNEVRLNFLLENYLSVHTDMMESPNYPQGLLQFPFMDKYDDRKRSCLSAIDNAMSGGQHA